ncbi:TspO/MBR family protein [Novosphingobium aquimarinum]|uniref:TspO/MBR family protein n=1 Tax=Novosphingobium aquimarinum TaxID=2682494 RepID=UPI0012ECA10B|nr:TspO/MBR family protein [Novosphingobium aquimarinum]
MNVIASRGQLRVSLLRWTLVTVPTLLLLGMLSGKLAGNGPENPWFAALLKPDAYPPPQAFGIVWSILYALMGVALALVLSARGARGRGIAVIAFAIQLLLNLSWSPIFFAYHSMSGALIVLGVLDLAIVATIVLFWRVRPLAGLMLVPYLLWSGFATYLNWDILRLNPGYDGADVSGAVERIEL